ncbi:MAG: cupredoxin family copper-binding protein [Patescibacteria group bacterium]|nr:cupredoxin family copper-binding protein [Patescibacteria group bacterium]
MNKIIIGLVLVVLLGGGIYLLSQRSMPASSGTAVQTTPVTVNSNQISIKNFSFNPSTLTVKKGTTVTWVNEDNVTHAIKSATFNSQNLGSGDKFSFTFDNPGSFDYSCSIHPSMKGKIDVLNE